MRVFCKRFIILFLIFNLIFSPAFARETFKAFGSVDREFSTKKIPSEIVVRIDEDNKLPDGTIIPAGSSIICNIMQVQLERRWHKSGYILCKLKGYIPGVEDGAVATEETKEETVTKDKTASVGDVAKSVAIEKVSSIVDLSDKNIYMTVRKYENIDGKDAAILTTEIVVTQAAGIVGSCFIFFAPVDIAYFFTKGAIRREKHHNWFKAGVYDAYDNSIFWFGLKGKPIDLEAADKVKIQTISEKKANKLSPKIAKRNKKLAIKNEKKAAKLEAKNQKKLAKWAKEKEKNPEKFEKKMERLRIKQEEREERIAWEIEEQQEILARRAEKAKLKKERKEEKKQLKQEKLKQKAERKAEKKALKAKQKAEKKSK